MQCVCRTQSCCIDSAVFTLYSHPAERQPESMWGSFIQRLARKPRHVERLNSASFSSCSFSLPVSSLFFLFSFSYYPSFLFFPPLSCYSLPPPPLLFSPLVLLCSVLLILSLLLCSSVLPLTFYLLSFISSHSDVCHAIPCTACLPPSSSPFHSPLHSLLLSCNIHATGAVTQSVVVLRLFLPPQHHLLVESWNGEWCNCVVLALVVTTFVSL